MKNLEAHKPQLVSSLFGKVGVNIPKIVELELSKIIPNPDQPRKIFSEQGIRELADSIESVGLIQPVTVKRMDDDRYMLAAGERRYRAHQLLGRERILAIVTKTGNVDELSLIENLQREDLSPIEEAEGLSRLITVYEYTQESLGKVIGKAQETVSSLLKLNRLPERIRQECPHYSTSNKITKSMLIEISRLGSEEEQLRVWDEVKEGGVTIRQIRERNKSERRAPSAPMIAASFTKEGKKIGTLTQGSRGIRLSLASGSLKEEDIKELEDVIRRMVERNSAS